MDRVKDYASFVAWFVGLVYVALGTAQTLPLTPGLHLIGALAALWVAVGLISMLCRRLLTKLLPATPQIAVSPVGSRARLQRWAIALSRRFERLPPPRHGPPRREFGLRRDAR